MPEGQVLEFSGVTKRFGSVTAISDFTARVEPGVVTGFLGPNGAGKTTTLRILLGLIRSTEGTATVGGHRYLNLRDPLQHVGAVLDSSRYHPGRSGANHLKSYAHAAGLPLSRVDDTLGLVGLADAAGRKVGGYSLGMRQRLGLAFAMLGNPGVLVFDEPTNGLDPEGIKWMRGFLRQLATDGRTVLVSSHLLTEVQQSVDALLIISQGRLVFQGGLSELVSSDEQATIADAPDRARLSAALTAAGVPHNVLRAGIVAHEVDPALIGHVAAQAGIPLSLLQQRGPALEEVFLDLVSGARIHPSGSGYGSATLAPGTAPAAPEPPAAEAPVPAVAVPEAPVPEVAVPEVPVPEVAVPGAAVPEAPVPEVAVPEAPVPEVPVPGAAVPGAAVPTSEVAVPEVAVPEAPVPAAPAPEDPEPEVAVPEAAVGPVEDDDASLTDNADLTEDADAGGTLAGGVAAAGGLGSLVRSGPRRASFLGGNTTESAALTTDPPRPGANPLDIATVPIEIVDTSTVNPPSPPETAPVAPEPVVPEPVTPEPVEHVAPEPVEHVAPEPIAPVAEEPIAPEHPAAPFTAMPVVPPTPVEEPARGEAAKPEEDPFAALGFDLEAGAEPATDTATSSIPTFDSPWTAPEAGPEATGAIPLPTEAQEQEDSTPDTDDAPWDAPEPWNADAESADPESANPEPAVPEPVTPEPVTPEPATAQSRTSPWQPPEPPAYLPVTPEPATPEPVIPEPVAPEPVTPAAPEPAAEEPVTPAPAAWETGPLRSRASLRANSAPSLPVNTEPSTPVEAEPVNAEASTPVEPETVKPEASAAEDKEESADSAWARLLFDLPKSRTGDEGEQR